ncbi:plasmid mobilization relaxosome protein MobC [Corynebacterium xerosis]|uniref:plasmid mobilization relaxosome protein MobC n=1 Tax=Corynebacterium xerosis TaxID=1725 RepID=UPI0013CE951F|nr:plasmid mobilization relaxosome protein MobC [Corynebacterium xerosis]
MARATTDRRRPNLDARITTRFDEVELAEVKARASKFGLAPSAFVRAIVLDFIEDDGRAMPAAIAGAIDGGPQGRSEELAELRVEVNKVGVNLNQLTRAFNRGQVQGRTFSEHEALMMALGETAAAMREVRDLLGGTR